ncbi:MAG: hypothetical protein KF819_11860 [Labilithrix sp.]|nr:hypothetical protein [Labilithrix sp.]
MKLSRAVSIVDRVGIALVYPLKAAGKKAPEVPSLWGELYPRSTMEWRWDEDADPRVAEVWHLREVLARSAEVAYAKWFRGRATFFSLPVFHALLGALAESGDVFGGLPRESHEILDALRERSPRSTKELRKEVGLQGRPFESLYAHATKALWSRLLIVGIGEIDDGAFPSLAVAATETMFEDLWLARHDVPARARAKLAESLSRTPAFARQLEKAQREIAEGGA